MALIDFTGYENWNVTAGLAMPGWTVGSVTRSTSAFKTGVASGLQTTGIAGGLNGHVRTLSATEEHATIIVGFWLYSVASNAQRTLLRLSGDNGATHHITYTLEANGTVNARFGNYDSVTVHGTGSVPSWANAQWRHFEFKTTLSDSVGVVSCRIDGTSLFHVTGLDTKNAGTDAVFDTVLGPGITNSADDIYIDDYFIINGDTSDPLQPSDYIGGARIYRTSPSGNGQYSGFVGSDGDQVSNYLLVDETDGTPGTDYVEAATDGIVDMYAMSDIVFPTGATVLGLKLTAIAQNSGAGARKIKLGVRSGTTDNMDAGTTLSTSAQTVVSRLLPKNPVTSAAWSQSEINAVQAGFESAT